MDFYELNAFLVLSKSLKFSKASKELNMSPSALSRMISRLEDELGVLLFDRNSREVLLTDNGKKFSDFAKNCLIQKNELFDSFSEDKNELSGTLNVFASVTACYSIMPPFIKKLTEKYPAVHLSVETGDPALAFNAVREGRAQLAVAAIPQTKPYDLECISMKKSPLVFAASSSGPYTKVQGSPQDIVSSVPLILPKEGLARLRFDSWIKSRNVKPFIAAETEGNEAVMALAALGIGIGLVPKIVLENGPYKEGFVYHSAGNALGYYDIGFIQKSGMQGTERERKLRNAISEILKNIASSNEGS